MAGINKVIIVGNLGNDPETRTFPGGGSVTNISVATSEKWTDKQTGQPQERTEWHRISFNGKLAEIAAQYLRKGSKVYVEGKLKTTKYQDKQTGQDKYSTDIVAREMQMLDSKGDNANVNTGYAQPAPPQAYQQPPAPQTPQQAPPMQQYTQQPQAPVQPNPYANASNGLDDLPY